MCVVFLRHENKVVLTDCQGGTTVCGGEGHFAASECVQSALTHSWPNSNIIIVLCFIIVAEEVHFPNINSVVKIQETLE